MFRVLLQTSLAFILLIASGYLSFVFLESLADGPKTWAIIAALPMLASSIFLFLKAGKSDATVVKKVTIPTLGENETDTQTGLAARINENNKMSAEWNNTNKARERLHMLEIQSSVGKN